MAESKHSTTKNEENKTLQNISPKVLKSLDRMTTTTTMKSLLSIKKSIKISNKSKKNKEQSKLKQREKQGTPRYGHPCHLLY